MFPKEHRGIAQLVEQWSPKPRAVSSNLTAPAKKKRQFSTEDCRFFCSLHFYLFVLLSSLKLSFPEKR